MYYIGAWGSWVPIAPQFLSYFIACLGDLGGLISTVIILGYKL